MSGKANKNSKPADGATTPAREDVKSPENTTGEVSQAPLAPAPATDGQALQSAVAGGETSDAPDPAGAVEGVIAQPVTDPELVGAVEETIVQPVTGPEPVGAFEGTIARPVADEESDVDVTVLTVCAVPDAGFHRAGYFWPTETVCVLVSDTPLEYVPVDDKGHPLRVINAETAVRLQQEKMLVVTERRPRLFLEHEAETH